MPLNCLLICCSSSHKISSLSLCASQDFLGQRLSCEPESVGLWAGQGCAQLLQEQRCFWQGNSKKSISGGCWKLKDEPGAARDVNSSRGSSMAPGCLSARGAEGISGPALGTCWLWKEEKLPRNTEKGECVFSLSRCGDSPGQDQQQECTGSKGAAPGVRRNARPALGSPELGSAGGREMKGNCSESF